MFPAYLQLAPLPEELCSSGNAADYQRLIGIMGLSPLRGSLRAAPRNQETEVSLYPTSPSWRSAAPHGCLVSLLIARSGWRSWRQKTSRFEKRGKIRSTDYSVVKEPRRASCKCPSTLQRTFFHAHVASKSKIFFDFFLDLFLPSPQSCSLNTVFCGEELVFFSGKKTLSKKCSLHSW